MNEILRIIVPNGYIFMSFYAKMLQEGESWRKVKLLLCDLMVMNSSRRNNFL